MYIVFICEDKKIFNMWARCGLSLSKAHFHTTVTRTSSKFGCKSIPTGACLLCDPAHTLVPRLILGSPNQELSF
jgi:hypothetical protein